MLLTISGRSFIKIQYSSILLFHMAHPFRIATQLQYYVKREKCKVNDIIFPSGCEARAINLGNKNMKISISTGIYQCKIEKHFHHYFSISYRKAWNKHHDCESKLYDEICYGQNGYWCDVVVGQNVNLP